MDKYDEYRDDFLASCSNGDFKKAKEISEKCDGYVAFECPVSRENGLHKCARNCGNKAAILQIAEYILTQNPKLAWCLSKNNCTPFIIAVHFQQESFVRVILDNARLDHKQLLIDFNTDSELIISDTQVYDSCTTALHIAILSENMQMIKLLLSSGASIWISNKNGDTALELAQKAKHAREMMSIFCDPKNCLAGSLISSGIDKKITVQLLNILLDNSLDVNSKDSDDFPLLHAASLKRNVDVVRLLISRGANINLRDSHNRFSVIDMNKMAAIHIAARQPNFSILQTLLEAHADVNLRDGYGQTALHILCDYVDGNTWYALDCCEILIQHGARLFLQDNRKSTPLVTALSNHTSLILAIYIISAGGDVSYSTSMTVQLFDSIKFIPKKCQKMYIDILFESGFPILGFLKNVYISDEIVTYIWIKHSRPRTLKRLAANVIKQTMVPNAWVSLNELPLPPMFDRSYIILHPKYVVSQWFKKYNLSSR